MNYRVLHDSVRAPSRITIVVAALALVGCATAPVEVPPGERPGPLPVPVAAFTLPGTSGFSVESGTIESAYGCALAYEYYEPEWSPDGAAAAVGSGAEPGLVVLAHGFMRDLSTTRGWAREWAARGVRTVAVSFCNSGWLNGRHDRNAEDLVAVARHIVPGPAPIVYAGFSAGGLSALIAAGVDSRATAYLGLDPVDSGGLAASVGTLRMPALFLFAAPSSCNAENNMLSAMPEANRRIALRIPYATHCDFENPTDAACERICGSVEGEVGEEIRTTIGAIATAWVDLQMGASPTAFEAFHAVTLAALEQANRVEIVVNE